MTTKNKPRIEKDGRYCDICEKTYHKDLLCEHLDKVAKKKYLIGTNVCPHCDKLIFVISDGRLYKSLTEKEAEYFVKKR